MEVWGEERTKEETRRSVKAKITVARALCNNENEACIVDFCLCNDDEALCSDDLTIAMMMR